jgi:tetratricopeptide (TPR) repeat protein
LLRNLDNAPELRRNPLVAGLFGAAPDPEADCLVTAGIRRSLEGLLPRLNGRHRTMLEQCDLAGRPHKVVAAELGLERRQFYRERRRLRQRVAEWLATGAAEPAATCIDRTRMELAHLHALRHAGVTDRLLRDGANVFAAVEDDARMEVGNLLIEVSSECGELDQARDFARALQTGARSRNDIGLEWGRAYLLQMRGRYRPAAEVFLRIVERCRQSEQPGGENVREAQARAAIEYGQCMHIIGDYEAARHGWEMAGELLARREISPATRAQTLWLLAAAEMMAGGDVDAAAAAFDRVLNEAVHYDLPRETVDILIARANANRQRNKLDEAVTNVRDALSLARRVFGDNAFAWRALNIAIIELAAGNTQRAIDLVHQAGAAKGGHHMRDGFGEWIESSALLAAGEVQRAMPVSLQAVADLRAAENERHLGASLRIYAEVASRTRRRREAIEAIDEAVELLSRFGLPNARANALRSRSHIVSA